MSGAAQPWPLLTPQADSLRLAAAEGGLTYASGLLAMTLRNAQTRDAVLLIVQAVVILLLVTILENVSRWRRKNDKEQQSPHSPSPT